MTPERTIAIRAFEPSDADARARLRSRLWPEADAAALRAECVAFERGAALPAIAAVFIALDWSNALIGFIELAIRAFADGCDSMPIPHVEGWYVEPHARRSGAGRALMRAGEAWAQSLGYTELASDAEIDNVGSLNAHERCGFVETERLVKFRKILE